MAAASSTPSYASILALPHVKFIFGSALAGRFAYAIVGLPLLLSIQSATGSFGAAGLAMGVFGATVAFLAPVRARIIDRFGRRRTLAPFAIAFGLSLTALAAATSLSSDVALFVIIVGLGGSVAPPLGPSMRVLWAQLTPTPAHLRKALSLDAVLEELLYLGGPALAGFLLLAISPSTALLIPAALVVFGAVAMVASPAAQESQATPAADAVMPERKQGRERSLLSQGLFLTLLIPVLAAGLIVGAVYVVIPAALAGPGTEGAIGIVLAAFAAGSAVGGLLYARTQPKAAPQLQLLVLATALTLGAAAIAIMADSAVGLGVILLATGLFLSPIMIVGYFAASGFGGAHRQTMATTWVNTSHNLGAAAGSVVAGIVIEAAGPAESILTTAAAAAILIAASALILVWVRRIRTPVTSA
jgi:predicted MFS family arabinose efflux permease